MLIEEVEFYDGIPTTRIRFFWRLCDPSSHLRIVKHAWHPRSVACIRCGKLPTAAEADERASVLEASKDGA